MSKPAPLSLSSAIRLGAMLKPQSFSGGDDGKSSCALLAASDALGIRSLPSIGSVGFRFINYGELMEQFPILTDELVAEIFCLNDSKKWTREAIADWVATIEASQDQPAPAVEVPA